MAVGGVLWLIAVIVVAIIILLLIKKVQQSRYGVKTGIVGILFMIKQEQKLRHAKAGNMRIRLQLKVTIVDYFDCSKSL